MSVLNVITAVETLLVVAGLVLLWRYVVSPRARTNSAHSPLPAWQAEPVEFLLLLLLVMLGSFVAAAATAAVVRAVALKGDGATLMSGAAAQLGMLGGMLVYAARSPGFRAQARLDPRGVVLSGVVTFVISLPVLTATTKAWEVLLQVFHLPAARQDLIRMFAEARNPVLIIALIGLATVVAPVTEEMVFRAGLFRFLRTRAPRFLALLVPALIFASLHVNWNTLEGFASFAPLIVLALLFSCAYERTGHIGTTIVAHALFNLHTIVLIFLGVAV